MKTVGTKVRILMLVLAFVLVANMAPAHAIDKSLTDVKTATLQDETAISVNGIVMPYRPYLVDGEYYAPVQMMEIMFNANVHYDGIFRRLTVEPKVELFKDKSNLVDKEQGKYIDKNLPEYTVAKFLCNTQFFIEKKWYNIDSVASKIAMIDGELWMSLDAMAAFSGSTYNNYTPATDKLYKSVASLTKNPYMTFPNVKAGLTDVLLTDAGQPYKKYLNNRPFPIDGTWKGMDIINIDGKHYHTNVTEAIFVKNAAGLYDVTKTHVIAEGPFAGKDVTLLYTGVPFVNCGNYYDFSKKLTVKVEKSSIPAELVKGMDGRTYYFEGSLYHSYEYEKFFGEAENTLYRFQWTRVVK